MLWRALILIGAAKCIEQTTISLSPEFNDVLENSTLELTCYASNVRYTKWTISNHTKSFSTLLFSKEGTCTADNFLNETLDFETRCFSNGTFIVKIKRVHLYNHGQEWSCMHMFNRSTAFIAVQVPTKYVRFKNISGNVIKTVENVKTTLTCETAEGRPAANITWIKICKKGTKTDITHDTAYAVTTARNMTIVTSSIYIEPVREDNGSRIICEATNMKPYVVRQEIIIHVRYPPGKPYFQFNGQNEFVKNGTYPTNKIVLEETSSLTVVCKADGYPSPTCTWNVHRDLNSQNLTFTNISKDAIGLYKCFAQNIIKGSFPENDIKTNTSSDLEIDVLYQSRVVMFYSSGHKQNENVFGVTESETVIFNCSVDSNPEASITLSISGKELGHEISAKALIHTRQITSCKDDGIYKCSAQNRYNKKPSFKELRLNVRCKPRVSPEFIPKSTVSTGQNSTVTFDFKAIANPMPVFKWFKFSGSFWSNLSTSRKYKIHSTGLSSSLSIRSITKDDYGNYKLEIQNEIGALEQNYLLKANDTTEDQEQYTVESSIPRTVLLVAVGTLGSTIFIVVLVFFGYRRRRQVGSERSERQPIEEVIENQSTASNDDNNVIYEEIDNACEHLEERFKERTVYMEMQNIETENSHKDYITPII